MNFIVTTHTDVIPYVPLTSNHTGYTCVTEPSKIYQAWHKTYICPPPRMGRYVVVQNQADAILVICEIEINEGEFSTALELIQSD